MTIVGVIRVAVTMVTQDHHAIYVNIYNLYSILVETPNKMVPMSESLNEKFIL